ncbi:MAG TPA: thioredoxin family protein [Elusimicrobiales bacterium]|nr:thioredoxin family protein [Elusimicrobiales bacterium]
MKRNILIAAAALLLAGGAWAAPKEKADIGKPAPAFTAPDIGGKKVSLSDHKGKFVVLEWTNYGCPFVQKHYGAGNMQALQKEVLAKGGVWLTIVSSAKGKQGYMTAKEWGPAAKEQGSSGTAILLDPAGKVGRLYGAVTTPHMYIVDPKGTLIYKGAIDDKPTTKQEDIPGAVNYVRQALDEAMAGKPVSVPSTKPYGCSVKYK